MPVQWPLWDFTPDLTDATLHSTVPLHLSGACMQALPYSMVPGAEGNGPAILADGHAEHGLTSPLEETRLSSR